MINLCILASGIAGAERWSVVGNDPRRARSGSLARLPGGRGLGLKIGSGVDVRTDPRRGER